VPLEIKIRKGAFQHVESELYAYHETCRELIRLKNEILHGGSTASDENVGGGRSNIPGDPTARTATLLVAHRDIEHMQHIIDAISRIYDGLPKDKQKLIRMKYWTKPQTLTWDGIAAELKCGRATALRWRDEIVVTIARRLGWK
jgi:RinA family phage transcriptional activator